MAEAWMKGEAMVAVCAPSIRVVGHHGGEEEEDEDEDDDKPKEEEGE
jgi:hypothetical protein